MILIVSPANRKLSGQNSPTDLNFPFTGNTLGGRGCRTGDWGVIRQLMRTGQLPVAPYSGLRFISDQPRNFFIQDDEC